MQKQIMAKLSELNISARELFSLLVALAAFVGFVINSQSSQARLEESVQNISESVTEIKEDQKEIRNDIKQTNDRIDRVLTLKN